MTSSWRDYDTVGLAPHVLDEGQDISDRGRRIEDRRMGNNPDEPAEHEVRDTIRFVSVDEVLQPLSVTLMVRSILTIGIDQHVNIREQHPVVPLGLARTLSHLSQLRVAGQ